MAQSKVESLLKAANSSTDNDSSVNVAKRTFLSEADSITFFNETRAKLVRIEEWRKNSSATDYGLFDASGQQTDDEPISVGRFIRISLYGSGKHDWVRVLSIADGSTEVVMTVKPSHDPTQQPPDKSVTSHFFGPKAENNFCVQRDGKTVAFHIIGLREKQNTAFTDSLIESARNMAVSNVGYYSGLQKAVWKQFATNFLKTDEEKED